MKKRIAAALALLLLASSVAACKGKNRRGQTSPERAGGMIPFSLPRPEPARLRLRLLPRQIRTAPRRLFRKQTPGQARETETASAPAETDTETEPAHIWVPAGEPADLTPILRGESAGYDMRYNFAGASLNALRADANLRFSQSGDMTAGEQGLTVPADRWAAVGFARSMNAPAP